MERLGQALISDPFPKATRSNPASKGSGARPLFLPELLERRTLVHGHMVGLVAFNQILRFIL